MRQWTTGSRWAVILAGGDGIRLRSLTRRIAGDERPKQFCGVLNGETLLEHTLRRTAWLFSRDETLVVVVRAHERFYAPLLTTLPSQRLVAQPENRGTAAAILCALLRLDGVAPTSPVAIFPSDHYVSDDEVFMSHVAGAFEIVAARPNLVVLLAATPSSEEAGYGWIEPGDRIIGPWSGPWSSDLRQVRGFWEKPSPALARGLRADGCLWNTFIMVGQRLTLMALIKTAVPAIFGAVGAAQPEPTPSWEAESLRSLYSRLPSTDFSRDVLAKCPPNLAVLPMRGVEWSDLGDPGRVIATLRHIGIYPDWAKRELEFLA